MYLRFDLNQSLCLSIYLDKLDIKYSLRYWPSELHSALLILNCENPSRLNRIQYFTYADFLDKVLYFFFFLSIANLRYSVHQNIKKVFFLVFSFVYKLCDQSPFPLCILTRIWLDRNQSGYESWGWNACAPRIK